MKKTISLLIVIFIISISQTSYPQPNLSTEDLEYIQELKEKYLWPDRLKVEDVTPEILNEIKNLINSMEREYKTIQEMEMKKPLTANELTQLDTHLRSKWNSMRDSLSRGNVEHALVYFSKSARNNYSNMFNSFSKKECKQLSQDLKNIEFIGEMGNSAEYDLRRSAGGKELSFQVIFVKDVDGKWYIESF